MSVETVTLEQAVQLLSLPRVVGVDPEAVRRSPRRTGRYGPYLKKGTDSRSLTSEDQLFTVTLDEALEIYRQPKQRGRRTAAATPPLRELGADTATGKPMVIKDGRFGPYVTDGETNASLRKGDSVEEITDERASELLARAAREGPGPEEAGGAQACAEEAAAKAPARKKTPTPK
jgi:DNA topoisomerase-1